MYATHMHAHTHAQAHTHTYTHMHTHMNTHTHSEAEFQCKIWEAIEKYVSSIVDEFYRSEADINDDTELQDWAADIHTNRWDCHMYIDPVTKLNSGNITCVLSMLNITK